VLIGFAALLPDRAQNFMREAALELDRLFGTATTIEPHVTFKQPFEGDVRVAAAYLDELAASTAVGVIRFLRPAADFRGQALKAGLYSLRYAVIPADGNHLGVSEYPDFLLVIPVADDPDPEAKLNLEELMSRSRRATGTRHPGVLSLTPPSGTEFPSSNADERGRVVLQVKAKLRSGADAPLALVVQGHAEQ
jgi:hypothetical protein